MDKVELNNLIKKSDVGDVESQYELGKVYFNGNGVQQDFKKAKELFEKAANQNFAKAQYRLGCCYFNGNGVQQDFKKAVECYEKSAEQGYDKAQSKLGFCYYWGWGIDVNYEKAVQWYEKSAEQGNKIAQCDLGECYYRGKGVKKDIEKAKVLFEKSIEQGYMNAYSNLGEYYYYLDLEIKTLDDLFVENIENYKKAMECFLMNTKPLNYYADIILNCLQKLNKIYENENKNIEDLYNQMLLFNNGKILSKLGEDYKKGYNVKQDLNKSLKCYLKIAEIEFSENSYNTVISFCDQYKNEIYNSKVITDECQRKIKEIKENSKNKSQIQIDLEQKIDALFTKK